MVGMARFLLILFVIFFIVRIFTRYVLRRYFSKMQQNFEDQQQQYQNKKEGDVTINTKPNSSKKIDKDEGDYVDYEEVKE